MNLNKTNVVNFINSNLEAEDKNPYSLADIFYTMHSNDKNFRLTTLGKNELKKLFLSYTINLTSKRNETTGTQSLTLNRYIRSPYYISRTNVLIVFEEMIASQLLMMDGDLDSWVQTKNYFD